MKKIFVVCFLAACGGPSETPQNPQPNGSASASASAAPSASAATTAKSWDSMSHDERLAVMKTVVLPKMTSDFQTLNAKKYEKFECTTCHGERLKKGDFKMPNPDLPHLSSADHFKKHMEKTPEITKFMMEKVVPDMAAAVGEKPFDPQTKTGFGCAECHIVGP
jgi:hypothetical protein